MEWLVIATAMLQAVVLLAVLLLVLLAALLLAGGAGTSTSRRLSPISRQHIDLFQGGQLSEAAVESAKARFRDAAGAGRGGRGRGEPAARHAVRRPGPAPWPSWAPRTPAGSSNGSCSAG